jgi:hypothetical protein
MNSAIADPHLVRRGGRAVDRAGLENRKAERSREFESHPLRVFHFEVLRKQGQEAQTIEFRMVRC